MINDEFKTIATTSEGFYSEKRSKFLAFAHHVETVDEIKELKHPSALALRGGGYPKTNAAAVAAVPFAYDGDALYRICAAANHHLTLTTSPVVK